MSAVLSESLGTLAGDLLHRKISNDDAVAQLHLMAQMALLLEHEVGAFRILETTRAAASITEAEATRNLHELARMPEAGGAEILPLRKPGSKS